MERTRQVEPVRGIAFDLEGTIIDIESLHHSAHLKAAAELGVALSRDDAIRRLPHFVGGPDEAVAVEIAALTGTRASPRDILAAKCAYFEELLERQQNIEPRRWFGEFLRWARSIGMKVAIGTVTPRRMALHLLETSGLASMFDDGLLVAREDVAAPKPAPDVYLETARRLCTSPGGQLVFEDSAVGLTSARAAGSHAAAVPTVKTRDFIAILYGAGAEAVFTTWRDPRIRSFVTRLAMPLRSAPARGSRVARRYARRVPIGSP
ncbi:MAG: HAD family phosphatase [Planctomycetes bacterium]|nr:HAD family phosphatase [Planctomycetota bacterium]